METTTRRVTTTRSTSVLLTLGVAFGAAAAAASHGLGPAPEHVSYVLGEKWGWLCVGFLACWTGKSWRSATVRGVTLLLPAVVTNEILGHVLRSRLEQPTPVGPGESLPEALFWILGSIVAATGLGALVVLIRRGGDLGVLAAGALPAFIARTAYDIHSRPPSADPVLHEVSGVIWPIAITIALAVLVVGFVRLAVRGRPPR